MAAQRFMRLLDIQVPVTQAVEAVGKQFRIGKRPRTLNGAVEVRTCLLVIASCPQEAEIKETLPFRDDIVSFVGSLEGLLVIVTGLFKIAEDIVGLPSCMVQRR